MVELTYLAIIGIVLAAMFFGYGFGLFEGRGQGYKRRKKEEEQEKESQPAPPPRTVTETVTVDDPGILRIKNEQGTFTLDLDGARVDPAALPPEQRKRLIEILSVMRPWLEGRPAPAQAPTSVAEGRPGTPPAITPTPQASLLERMQSRPVPPPPAQTPAQPAPPPPATNPAPASKPGTPAKDERPSPPPTSLVAQIDSVLQARLVGTPLEGRGIRLVQSPEGGANVYIGLTRYSGVDEVPDPEIKAAIRAAITEWEHKFTPGLK